MVETPVLFITFCRSDYARQTWEAIKLAQPQKLYFYSNKGRPEKGDEIERNDEIRGFIKEVNWDCEIVTWFRETCVDVYTSLRGAIDWFFQKEPEGIILEEDCVPTLAFFSFCEQLLNLYRVDNRVWFISGNNYLNYNPNGDDYIISRHSMIHGWASWSSRWNKIDWELKNIDIFLSGKYMQYVFPKKNMMNDKIYRIKNEITFLRNTYCWDAIFQYNMLLNNSYCLYPKVHLVSNIGVSGFHNKHNNKTLWWNIRAVYDSPVYKINKHPLFFYPDFRFEENLYRITWKKDSFIKHVWKWIKVKYYKLLDNDKIKKGFK